MSDEATTIRAARRPLPRIPFVGAVGIALLVGVAGYAVGHHQRSSAASAAPTTCVAAEAALKRQSDLVKTSGDDSAMRTLSNLVVENGQCFDPQLVATAQTLLDKLNQGATALEINKALCAAKPNPWWSC